jgi:hypothetical protein
VAGAAFYVNIYLSVSVYDSLHILGTDATLFLPSSTSTYRLSNAPLAPAREMPRHHRLEDVSCAICMDTLFCQRDDLDEAVPIATPDCGEW